MHRYFLSLLLGSLLCGCTTKRVLLLENQALRQDLNETTAQVQAYERSHLPKFQNLLSHLNSLGLSFESHPQGPYATSQCPESSVSFSAQVWEDTGLFYVATTELFDLYESHSTEGAFAAMAQVATINYDLPLAKLSVNERTGQVILSVQTPADDGLTRSLVRRAILELCTSAEKVRPVLRRAAQGDGL